MLYTPLLTLRNVGYRKLTIMLTNIYVVKFNIILMTREKKSDQFRKTNISATVDPLVLKEFDTNRRKYGKNRSQWLEIAMQFYNDYCENHPLTSRALRSYANQIHKL